ncbi:Bax inhibitor 1 [Branchiostoma belcheri]|nr:Bax inhibitor 1 [Branchiostoma belcheri]
MSRRRGRRRHRRSRARAATSPSFPACNVPEEPQDGHRLVFKAAMITMLLIVTVTTVNDFRVDCELCRHWGLSRRTGAKQNCAGGVEERRGRSRFFAGAKQNGPGAGAKQNGGGEEEGVVTETVTVQWYYNNTAVDTTSASLPPYRSWGYSTGTDPEVAHNTGKMFPVKPVFGDDPTQIPDDVITRANRLWMQEEIDGKPDILKSWAFMTTDQRNVYLAMARLRIRKQFYEILNREFDPAEMPPASYKSAVKPDTSTVEKTKGEMEKTEMGAEGRVLMENATETSTKNATSHEGNHHMIGGMERVETVVLTVFAGVVAAGSVAYSCRHQGQACLPVCGWCSALRTGMFACVWMVFSTKDRHVCLCVDGVQHQGQACLPVCGWCSALRTGMFACVCGWCSAPRTGAFACVWTVFSTKDRTGAFACVWMVFSTKDRCICVCMVFTNKDMCVCLCVDGVQHQGQVYLCVYGVHQKRKGMFTCVWMVFSTKDMCICVCMVFTKKGQKAALLIPKATWLLASFHFVQKRTLISGCLSRDIDIVDQLPKEADTPYKKNSNLCPRYFTSSYPEYQKDTMGRKLRHVLIFLLIILKEQNMPETACICSPSSYCRLQKLDLGSNQIATIDPGAFANLPQLQQLWLGGNHITTIDSSTLANLPQLQMLRLYENQISTIPSVFGLFPSNITIELDGNPWQCDCRMAPVRLIHAFKDQIICAQSTKLQGQKLVDVNPEELEDQESSIRAESRCCREQHKHISVCEGNAAVSVMASGDDHQYEDIDNHHVRRGKGQSITDTNINTTATVMTSGHDQAGQGQSQANTESNTTPIATYENIDKPRVKTGQGQANIQSLNIGNLSHNKVLAALKPNPMYAGEGNAAVSVMASGDDHQYEDIDNHHVRRGKGQSITDTNINTTATVMTSGHDQAGQGQTASQLNSLYKHNTATEMDTESNTNTTATVMTSDHYYRCEDIDGNSVKTEQGQSKTITESNTNTTATVMTSGEDNIGQANAQSPTIANMSRNEVLAALQPNPMYVDVKHPTSTEMASGHDQTGQDQSQTNIQSLKVGDLSYDEVLAALQPNTMYVDVEHNYSETGQGQSQPLGESNPKTTATVMTSGHDQAGQGQSQTNTESSTNTTATVMTSGHDVTGQDRSGANIHSLKVGNLSHNEVLAALQPNPMYVDVKMPPKDPTSTEIASGDDQTGQDLSQTNIQSLKVGDLSHNEVLAALQPNPMYVDVKTPPKKPTSTEMASGHDQAGQGHS